MRGPTIEQVQAVYDVMRMLREEDRGRGISEEDRIVCDMCHRKRAAIGSAEYGDRVFCNGCATDYELLRLAHKAPPLATITR